MPETSSEMIVLTDGEKKNGWTSETLRKYLDEREAQKLNYAARTNRKRVEIQNSASFNPYQW